MDWLDKTRIDRFTFEMIDPFNLDTSRGYLENVVSNSAKITWGYDTDTRVSGSLEAADHNYIYGSLIRMHHYVDEYNFHEELGTFFVSSTSKASQYTTKESFNLTSMLDRIAEDCFTKNFVVSANKTALDALRDIFGQYSVAYSISSNCNNKVYTEAVVYEVGENVLSTVFDIADFCNCDIDVNAHGVVEVKPYVSPSTKEPVFEFNDHNGTVNGEISKDNDPFGAVNRVIVVSEKDEKTVSGFADVSSSSKIAYSKLGRRNTSVESLNELNPFTDNAATNYAKGQIDQYEQDPSSFSFSGIYTNYQPGQVVTIGANNEYFKAMIKNKSFNLEPGMLTSYTCEEV